MTIDPLGLRTLGLSLIILGIMMGSARNSGSTPPASLGRTPATINQQHPTG
jgi:hypothetical protein